MQVALSCRDLIRTYLYLPHIELRLRLRGAGKPAYSNPS
ncbi:hypothetical protein BGLA2_700032 [Burkholderia gladioli]|nr:hypothetical protein BGLA2_700032 [Burkholderia gladioli]